MLSHSHLGVNLLVKSLREYDISMKMAFKRQQDNLDVYSCFREEREKLYIMRNCNNEMEVHLNVLQVCRNEGGIVA